MDKLVSVIVPVYNCEKYLGRCVESILSQAYDNLDVILVDDGSTDSSGAICDEYAARDSRIRAFHQENAGSSVARNYALDVMKGELVVFIDSDDYVAENYISVLCDNMKDEVDMVVSKPQALNPDGTVDKHWPFNSTEAVELEPTDKRNMSWQNRHFWVHSVLFRASVIGDTRFNKAFRVSQDTPFYCEVFKKCRRVRYIPEKLYYYIIFEESACHGKFNDKKFTEFYAWNEILRIFEGHPLYEYYLSNYALRCYRIYTAMIDVGLGDDPRTEDLVKALRKNLKYGLRLQGYQRRIKIRFAHLALLPKPLHKKIYKAQRSAEELRIAIILFIKKIIRK